MQSVVITGASTGIGWATAKLLLDRGFRVFGSVRKAAAHRSPRPRNRREFHPAIVRCHRRGRGAGRRDALWPRQQCRHCGGGAGARAFGRRIPPPGGCERHRVDHRHASFRSVARVRSVAEGKAGADRDDQLGGRKNGTPLLSAYSASKHRIRARPAGPGLREQ
jgi:NAD(P)-dependent dehydrogenase (short-subunit alcohol dehydrogenase family)